MKYYVQTYGCQMNEADSQLMSALLAEAGWEQCPAPEEADLIVLNTCSVREKPEHKVMSRLGELNLLKQARPDLIIAVTGCMAQRAGEAFFKRRGLVDLVIGTRSFHRIVELTQRVREGGGPLAVLDSSEDPSAARGRPQASVGAVPLRVFVPIIRGCSNFCSYCIVPFVRGRETSRPSDDIVAEIPSLAARGAREVTLLGQNVLAYGRDLADGDSFAGLLRRLQGIEGLWRVRFTTCHPRDVDDDLIDAIAGLSKVCEHMHLPLQAGHDRLLDSMHRGYDTAHYLSVVARLRAAVPQMAITTDIMVGFPGETEAEFEESLALYEQIGFDAAFMFAYSPRPGTAAAHRDDAVPGKTRLERLGRLIEFQNGITIARNQAELGQTAEVLVDGPAERGEGLLSGRTRGNKQTVFAGDETLRGSLVAIRLTEAHLWGFRGVIASP